MTPAEATAKIRAWRKSPVLFVRECLKGEPDAWQLDTLGNLADESIPVQKRMRHAMKACKGPGKTAVLAWIVWWFLLCFLHAKVACISITEDNLKDGLWPELAKWQNNSPLLKQAFTWTKTRVYANDHSETWFASARTWSKGADSTQQANALAGLHADNMMFVIDEAGGVTDAVAATAEAGLANADMVSTFAYLVIAGNPTHLEGPLYRACTNEAPLWCVTEITSDPDDPKRTPRVSADWARAQIEKYGRDNPWVLVNVFGKFPPSSINALLGPDDITAAEQRVIRPEDLAGSPRIIGQDVARYGSDASVLARRHGPVLHPLEERRNLNSLQGAGWVASVDRDFDGPKKGGKADAIFVDDTGGFGSGWIDQLTTLGRNPIGVAFSRQADDPRFFNKRSEMYFRAAEWVKKTGCLPIDPELRAELLAHTYVFQGDKLRVEEKDLVKEKLGRSPDKSDAFVLTFAYDVVAAPSVVVGTTTVDIASIVHDSYLSAHERAGEPYNPMMSR